MGIIETLDWVSRKELKFCGFLSLRLLMMQKKGSKTPMAKQEMTREKLSGDLSLARGLKRNGVCCAKSLLFQKEVKIVGVDDVDRRVSRKIKKKKKAPKLCKAVLMVMMMSANRSADRKQSKDRENGSAR